MSSSQMLQKIDSNAIPVRVTQRSDTSSESTAQQFQDPRCEVFSSSNPMFGGSCLSYADVALTQPTAKIFSSGQTSPKSIATTQRDTPRKRGYYGLVEVPLKAGWDGILTDGGKWYKRIAVKSARDDPDCYFIDIRKYRRFAGKEDRPTREGVCLTAQEYGFFISLLPWGRWEFKTYSNNSGDRSLKISPNLNIGGVTITQSAKKRTSSMKMTGLEIKKCVFRYATLDTLIDFKDEEEEEEFNLEADDFPPLPDRNDGMETDMECNGDGKPGCN